MMTKEEILSQVEERLGVLNHDARCAVEVAVEVMTAASNNATLTLGQQPLPRFEESNPSWQEMTQLGLQERSRLMQELEQRNKTWLEAKCQQLGAMWLLVVDGQVLRWGTSLASFVTDEEKAEIGKQTGKFPLYYEADWSLMIEESSPFVIINPSRVALVGRLACLDLQPIVSLDFAQRQTTVQF
jgi:hypothetical protein